MGFWVIQPGLNPYYKKIPSNVTFVQFQYDKLQPGIDFHFARVGMELTIN